MPTIQGKYLPSSALGARNHCSISETKSKISITPYQFIDSVHVFITAIKRVGVDSNVPQKIQKKARPNALFKNVCYLCHDSHGNDVRTRVSTQNMHNVVVKFVVRTHERHQAGSVE